MEFPKPEKESKTIIAELESDFQNWVIQDTDLATKVRDQLIKVYGYNEVEMSAEGFTIIKIPLNELSIFSTICGRIDNQAFDNKVQDYLKNRGVDFVVAISDKEATKIVSLIMKINSDDGEIFSDMVSKNGGSLRCEASKIEGWSTFESE